RQKFVVHAVGGFVRVHRLPWSGEPRISRLVVIGAGLDASEAHRGLQETVGDGIPDEHGILRITRYLSSV
ncbi:GTP-binding protein, partial [Streptomyces sp. SID10244]|nr:GTP-binding protein [Streptomyces sp. SID10244]